MATWSQSLATLLTLEAERVPVLTQGGLPFSEVHWLATLGTVRHFGQCQKWWIMGEK